MNYPPAKDWWVLLPSVLKLYGQRSKKNRKKSIKERYKKIAESEEYKQAYDGKSIGEVMEIEGM